MSWAYGTCAEWRAVCRGFGVETGVKFVGVDSRIILKCFWGE